MKQILPFLFLLSIPTIAQLQDDMLVYYTFDGNALDSSENEYHGSPFEITYTDDRFGNENSAALFNGIDSYVDLPNLSELKPQLPVSFAFWIRYDSNEWKKREVFNTSHEENISSGIFFNSEMDTGKFNINYGDGSFHYSPLTRRTFASDDTIVTGEWIHIAIIIKGPTDMDIIVNCKSMGGIYSGEGESLFYSHTPGSIGRHDRSLEDPANYFKGAIDDFIYWNRALTADEIEFLCQSLDINHQEKIKDILMFPNPAKEKLYFLTDNIDDDVLVEIFDSFGKRVICSPLISELNISQLSKGFYIVKFSNSNKTSLKKLIVQ